MKLIWDCVRRYPRMFAASLLFLALEAAADLFQPGFMALIVDKGVSSASPRGLSSSG